MSSNSVFANYPHTHHSHLNEDGMDLDFIEAAHADRERSVQIDSPVQAPVGGGTNIEHYAPKDVTVLALPVLYCMAHGTDHPCAHQHKIAQEMGVCDLSLVKDAHKYVAAERVSTAAKQTYTGRIERA